MSPSIRLRLFICLSVSVYGYACVSYYAKAQNSRVEQFTALYDHHMSNRPLPAPHASARETTCASSRVSGIARSRGSLGKYRLGWGERQGRPGPNWQPGATWDCAQTGSAKPRQAGEYMITVLHHWVLGYFIILYYQAIINYVIKK